MKFIQRNCHWLQHDLQMTSDSPASLSDGLFIQIVKCCNYPCLQFIFGGACSFVGFSLNRSPHVIIKGVAIWGVRQPNVRGDYVEGIFWLPTLGSSACVTRCRVLLPDVGFCSSHLLDLRQVYLLKELDVDFRVESEVMQEDNWWHNVTIAGDHTKKS